MEKNEIPITEDIFSLFQLVFLLKKTIECKTTDTTSLKTMLNTKCLKTNIYNIILH